MRRPARASPIAASGAASAVTPVQQHMRGKRRTAHSPQRPNQHSASTKTQVQGQQAYEKGRAYLDKRLRVHCVPSAFAVGCRGESGRAATAIFLRHTGLGDIVVTSAAQTARLAHQMNSVAVLVKHYKYRPIANFLEVHTVGIFCPPAAVFAPRYRFNPRDALIKNAVYSLQALQVYRARDPGDEQGLNLPCLLTEAIQRARQGHGVNGGAGTRQGNGGTKKNTKVQTTFTSCFRLRLAMLIFALEWPPICAALAYRQTRLQDTAGQPKVSNRRRRGKASTAAQTVISNRFHACHLLFCGIKSFI